MELFVLREFALEVLKLSAHRANLECPSLVSCSLVGFEIPEGSSNWEAWALVARYCTSLVIIRLPPSSKSVCRPISELGGDGGDVDGGCLPEKFWLDSVVGMDQDVADR